MNIIPIIGLIIMLKNVFYGGRVYPKNQFYIFCQYIFANIFLPIYFCQYIFVDIFLSIYFCRYIFSLYRSAIASPTTLQNIKLK